MRRLILFLIPLLVSDCLISAQTRNFEEEFNDFKNAVHNDYVSFRNECNEKYAEFLKNAWQWYEGNAPMPMPKELTPLPPRPYDDNDRKGVPDEVTPIAVVPVESHPQPKPIEPIREKPSPQDTYFDFTFYGITGKVRLPESARLSLSDLSPEALSNGWERLSTDAMNNAIRDCLEARIRFNLCDWAYLLFLDRLSSQFCPEPNGATLLMAYLYCQSGYQMRLGMTTEKLTMLYGSEHMIYGASYFNIGGKRYYVYGDKPPGLHVGDIPFPGESPLSLSIPSEQLLGDKLSKPREITSERYEDVAVTSQVPEQLISFYNTYPKSYFGGDLMTVWALYANTPLSQKTKDAIYPSLRKAIDGCSTLDAAEKLLDWVQTGFVYKLDDEVWGHDRSFFAEETLYYPYADCEDRAILFSRLVRDLLGLDVALIYYPGHLATAVLFKEEVYGDAMIIDGIKYIVCDPTYIGASVGWQMPGLDYDKVQAIVLER